MERVLYVIVLIIIVKVFPFIYFFLYIDDLLCFEGAHQLKNRFTNLLENMNNNFKIKLHMLHYQI